MKRELRDKIEELLELDPNELSSLSSFEEVEKIVSKVDDIIDIIEVKVNDCLSEITIEDLGERLDSLDSLKEASEMLY